jgi:hypothetical protein
MDSTSERDLRFVRKWVVSDRVKSEAVKGIMLTRGRDSLLGSRLGVQHR